MLMHVNQLSVFIENKIGRLKEITTILKEAHVNIRTLTLSDTSDFGVLRLIVDNHALAEESLKKQGFTLNTTKVLAVEVEDQPGGLHHILEVIQDSGINIEYLYAFVNRSGDKAINIFRFDNLEEAAKILMKNGIQVIDGNTLYSL